MARLSRKLRICKWTGTVGCALIVVAFVWSCWYDLTFDVCETQVTLYRVGTLYRVRVGAGCTALERREDYKDSRLNDARWRVQELRSKGWTVMWLPATTTDPWPAKCLRTAIPLWLPFLIVLIPTLLLWRRDRRRPRPGFCRHCDYDLTGNTSGRCPECGLEIAKPPTLSEPAPPG